LALAGTAFDLLPAMLTTTTFRKRGKTTLQTIVRWSYVAKGILFASLGTALLYDAWTTQADKPNRKEILELWSFAPLGKALLAFAAFVFLGHFVWRLLEAWFDPYAKGNGPGGLVYRLTYLLSGISYGALMLVAFRLLFWGKAGSSNAKQYMVFEALQSPATRWVPFLVGGILMLWASVQAVKGLTGSVVNTMRIDHLPGWARGFIRVSSLVGFLALATTLGTVGFSLIQAAWQENPILVKNMDDVFLALRLLPFGNVLLHLEAVGLLLFGGFMLTMAWYFPFRTA